MAENSSGRTRSPSYPSIDLEQAVQRAREVYQNESRNLVHIDVILGHWSYEGGSSNGMRAIAALKQFGLLDEDGKKENRQVRLSRLALEILLPEEDGDAQHRRLLQEAALMPPLHRELWDKYSGHLPSDNAMQRYLIVERNFNTTAVAGFIRSFRSTIQFAGLDREDTIEVLEEPSQPIVGPDFFPNLFGPPNPPRKSGGQQAMPATANQSPNETAFRREVITIPEGDVIIQWPSSVSGESIADLEDYLPIFLRKMRRSAGVVSVPRVEPESPR